MRLIPKALVGSILIAGLMLASLPLPVEASPEFFTIAVLPDAQEYVDDPTLAPLFDQQAQWIVDHATEQNIVFVTQLGDIVQDCTNATQWGYATHSMGIIRSASIPYSITPGNHCIATNANPNRNYADYLSQNVTFSGYAYALSTNNYTSAFGIYDGVGWNYTDIPKDDAWHYITVTRQVNAGASSLAAFALAKKEANADTDDTLYVDNVTFSVQGDSTNLLYNTTFESGIPPSFWEDARATLSREAVVVEEGSYSLKVVANDAVGAGNSFANQGLGTYTDTAFNTYFPYTDFTGYSWYGGNYPSNKYNSSYQLFSSLGQDFVILNLTGAPGQTANATSWANSVLTTYATRKAIIITHGYIDASGNILDTPQADSLYLWNNIVKLHTNVIAVLCGHVGGQYHGSNLGDGGNTIYSLLTDYQGYPNGGNGWLRLYKFFPDFNRIEAVTYSSYLDLYDKTTGASGGYFDLLLNMGGSSSSWWNPDFLNRMVLTGANLTNTSSNLTNFPFLVHLTSARFNFSEAQSNGEDIRFIDRDDSTYLDYEIESWNATAQEAFIWVKKPVWLAGSNFTDFVYMYHNNPAASDNQNAAAVWSNGYVLVDHYKDYPDTSHTYDSSGNSNNGTKAGAGNPSVITGKISQGQQYNGSTSYIDHGNSASLNVGANFTLEGWISSVNNTARDEIINKRILGAGNIEYQLDYRGESLQRLLFGFQDAGGGGHTLWSSSLKILDTNWHYVAGTYDAINLTLYLDDSGSESTSENATPAVTTHHVTTGQGVTYLGGKLDEIRISNVPRSADWIKATYRTETDQFLFYGDENPEPTITTNTLSGLTMNLAVTGGTLNGTLASLGGAPSVTVWFEFGADNITYGTNTTPQTFTNTANFTDSLPSDLTPGTTYHWRAVGQNALGISYGNDAQFTLTMPTVVTGLASQGPATITLTGVITDMGVASDTSAYFEWGYSPSYGFTTPPQTLGASANYTSTLTSFAPSTIHFRAEAQNLDITAYGLDQTFTFTLPPAQTGTPTMAIAIATAFVLCVIILAFLAVQSNLTFTVALVTILACMLGAFAAVIIVNLVGTLW